MLVDVFQSLHYFISFASLNNNQRIGDVSKFDLSVFLPTLQDCTCLKSNYAILLGRELAKNVPYFKQFFSEFVPENIPHKYSQQMGQKIYYGKHIIQFSMINYIQ
jgi:hypothetical protein